MSRDGNILCECCDETCPTHLGHECRRIVGRFEMCMACHADAIGQANGSIPLREWPPGNPFFASVRGTPAVVTGLDKGAPEGDRAVVTPLAALKSAGIDTSEVEEGLVQIWGFTDTHDEAESEKRSPVLETPDDLHGRGSG